MNRITPFLWFDDNLEQAIELYTSVFKDTKVLNVSRYTEAGPGPAGSVMTATFELQGQQFMALNAGPYFKFNEAVSFLVNCQTQQEVDEYWEKLTANGGEPGRCGWLKDRFGLSWQIVPDALGQLLSDPKRAKNVMQAMLQMGKINIAELEKAGEL